MAPCSALKRHAAVYSSHPALDWRTFLKSACGYRLPLALTASRQPSAANYKLEYTGDNGTAEGKRYRFVGEDCVEPQCQGPTIPGTVRSLAQSVAAC